MKNVFISLVTPAPPGFAEGLPSKRQLLGGYIAIFAESTDTAAALLEDYHGRVRGLVITKGAVTAHDSLGPSLYHLEVTEEMLPGLYEVAACFLESMSRSHEALDETWAIKIELERQRASQERAQQAFNENGTRLVAKVEDLRREIEERERMEQEKLALERQILHAQKLESLGVLAGGIAHDFNNLLMAILGNADLALDELSPMSPARGKLLEIEKASKRAAELAKQMLAYSGKGRFVVEPIDLGELLEEMVHLLKVSICKKASLRLDLSSDLPPFEGDATQLRQVIMNLITNASEALEGESGTIALSTGKMFCDAAYIEETLAALGGGPDITLPEGDYVFIEVADTGCGMDKQTLERIFDPFFSTKFTGRGLGMSAVLGIIRGHDGLLKIYSEVGKGTTFKALFPTSQQAQPGRALHASPAPPEDSWRGSGTILIVDDEEAVRSIGRRMLERLGFTVFTANNGLEALECLREHRDEITCVLLDLTMPQMDGEEAFREMRRTSPDITVLLCSGYNEQDATQRFVGKGLAGFLQKPFTMRGLKRALMEVLG